MRSCYIFHLKLLICTRNFPIMNCFCLFCFPQQIDRFGHFKIWHAVGTVLVSAAFYSFFWGVCVPCKIIGIDTPLVQMIGYYMFDILFSGGWSCTQVSHM